MHYPQSIDNIQKRQQICFSGNLDGQTAAQMALPHNTSTKPNLESTKLAQFTPKEKCVQKPEPNILQYMILGFWTLAFAANMMRNMKRNPTNQVKPNDQIGGGEWSNWWRIVCPRLWQKLWTKIFFSRAFSENSCAAGSNYVPILSAAMDIFFRIGLWT